MKEILTVIVPAAGAGKRMGLGKNKAFITIRGIPLLVLCMKMLAGTGMVRRVIVVTRAMEIQETEMLLREYRSRCFPEIDWQVAAGGKERQDSVASGLAQITDTEGYVAVHDGARPLITPQGIRACLEAAAQTGAAACAHPVVDTLKRADAEALSLPEKVSRD